MVDIFTDIILPSILVLVSVVVTLIGLYYYLYIYDSNKPKKVKIQKNVFKSVQELATNTTDYACDRPAITMTEMIDNGGIFKQGIKASPTGIKSIEQQYKQAKKLDYVTKLSKNMMKVSLNLGKFGMYSVNLSDGKPHGNRTDVSHTYKYHNPYLHPDIGRVCLGSSDSLYRKCWLSKNYIECIRLLREVLICDDDTNSYRRWHQCYGLCVKGRAYYKEVGDYDIADSLERPEELDMSFSFVDD